MKKLLAVVALAALSLSAPAHAQSASGGVPSVIGGGLTEGAAVAVGVLLFVTLVATGDDDSSVTTTTTR